MEGFKFPNGRVCPVWAAVGPYCSLLVLTALAPILEQYGAPGGRGALASLCLVESQLWMDW